MEETMEKKDAATSASENSVVVLGVNGKLSLCGLNEEQMTTILTSLTPAYNGYLAVSSQSFSQQKATFYQLQPELQKLSNKQLRVEIESQLRYGKTCGEILVAIEQWRSSQQKEETN